MTPPPTSGAERGDGTPYVFSGRRCLAVDDACEFAAPAGSTELADLAAATARALDEPLGTPALTTLAAGAREVALAVPDASRDCPVAALLPPLLERLLERYA